MWFFLFQAINFDIEHKKDHGVDEYSEQHEETDSNYSDESEYSDFKSIIKFEKKAKRKTPEKPSKTSLYKKLHLADAKLIMKKLEFIENHFSKDASFVVSTSNYP